MASASGIIQKFWLTSEHFDLGVQGKRLKHTETSGRSLKIPEKYNAKLQMNAVHNVGQESPRQKPSGTAGTDWESMKNIWGNAKMERHKLPIFFFAHENEP